MSAIYKEGYWYPADSLNTLKAVTMSNADYEALTPQEKEELGGIEIFIPDRPLTGGGTGAVMSTANTGGGGAHNHGFTQPTAHTYTPAGTNSAPTFTGTQATINHLQPYITCYMWKRVA